MRITDTASCSDRSAPAEHLVRGVCLTGSAALVVATGLLIMAGPAAAGGAAVTYTDSTQVVTATVPAGECSATFTLVGGSGGAGDPNDLPSTSAGGLAGAVTATLAVTPGESYRVAVGAAGMDGSNSSSGTGGVSGGSASGGTGGLVGIANGSGGGGGASSIALGTATAPTLVAAGGGGGGGSATSAGGAGGAAGTAGTGTGSGPHGDGGAGATPTAPGAGGNADDNDPADDNGHAGVGSVGGGSPDQEGRYAGLGGGGGGGHFGGGGGSSNVTGAGGGGGSNLAPANAAVNGTTSTAGAGSVSVAFSTTCLVTSSKPTFVASAPPSGTMGSSYDYTFTSTGSPKPSYSIAAGSLPPGLTLNTSTGALSGTPTTAGTYHFVVAATNSAGRTLSRSITLAIHAVASATLPVPSTAATSSLPFTGANVGELVGYGSLFLLAGAALRTLGARRRR